MAACRFARAHNTVVIRWLSKQSEWIQKLEGQDAVSAEYQDPVFWEYFLSGAKRFITENINKPLGLVNGRTCKYSSLLLLNEMDLTNFRTWIDNKAKPGDVYDLLEPPTAVNITLELDVSGWKSTKIHALTPLSIEPVRFVENGMLAFITVPMLPQSTHNPWKKAKPVPVGGSKTFPASKVSIQDHFPIEMGFAITVHESEGQTLDKVILALSYHEAKQFSLDYWQVYVALSRVKKREDIGLLLTGTDEVMKWQSIQYLWDLKPDASVQAFFAGFKPVQEVAGHTPATWINTSGIQLLLWLCCQNSQ